jgi:general nucleoside transport system permease protein
MEFLGPLLAATFNSGTVIALAALGLLVNERAGVVNLGAEGMMLIAAMVSFAVAFTTGSATLAFLAGAAAGAVCAGLLAVLVIWFNTNQYASGLALSLFGTGFSAFLGIPYVGKTIELFKTPTAGLSQLPFVGPAFFGHHPLVYGTVVLAAGITWFLFRTRAGLVLRSIGESPESAHALGYPVRRVRLAAMLFGGACCGLAGAYLSVIYTPLWVESMTAGRGWIALALTTFATWRPMRVLLGAYLFGGITMLQFHLQGEGVQIASQWLSMLPYLATILVLVLISRNPTWIRVNMPASLGKPFSPSA